MIGVISGIVHMLKSGARWRDCPPEYGPYTTVYNRFNRWSRQGIWLGMFERAIAAYGHPRYHPYQGIPLVSGTGGKAKANCPVSKALAAISVTLAAKLG